MRVLGKKVQRLIISSKSFLVTFTKFKSRNSTWTNVGSETEVGNSWDVPIPFDKWRGLPFVTSGRWSALVPASRGSCTVEDLKQLRSAGQITGRRRRQKFQVTWKKKSSERENESVNLEDHVPGRFERRSQQIEISFSSNSASSTSLASPPVACSELRLHWLSSKDGAG